MKENEAIPLDGNSEQRRGKSINMTRTFVRPCGECRTQLCKDLLFDTCPVCLRIKSIKGTRKYCRNLLAGSLCPLLGECCRTCAISESDDGSAMPFAGMGLILTRQICGTMAPPCDGALRKVP